MAENRKAQIDRGHGDSLSERAARLHALRREVLLAEGRSSLFADEHPEALQELVDPSIRLSTAEPESYVWALPAGWVSLVNRLHRDLAALLGDYEVTLAGQKAGGLRFYVSPVARGEAHDRIAAAREESLDTCEVCGEPGAHSRFSTRCSRHPVTGPDRILGAVARPPGRSED